MLHIHEPSTSVLLLIRITHQALTVFLPILETTHVNFPIFEFLCAKTIHESVLKLSYIILLQICIVVRSLSIEYSI